MIMTKNHLFSWLTIYYPYRENISTRFSSNPEADASGLLENLVEMF